MTHQFSTLEMLAMTIAAPVVVYVFARLLWTAYFNAKWNFIRKLKGVTNGEAEKD